MGRISNTKETPWTAEGVEIIARTLYHDFKRAFFGQRETKELKRVRLQLLRGDVPEPVDAGDWYRVAPTPDTPDGKWFDFRTVEERVRIDTRILTAESGDRIRVSWTLACDVRYHAWLISPETGLPEDVEGTLQYIMDLQRVRRRFEPAGKLADAHYPTGETFPSTAGA